MTPAKRRKRSSSCKKGLHCDVQSDNGEETGLVRHDLPSSSPNPNLIDSINTNTNNINNSNNNSNNNNINNENPFSAIYYRMKRLRSITHGEDDDNGENDDRNNNNNSIMNNEIPTFGGSDIYYDRKKQSSTSSAGAGASEKDERKDIKLDLVVQFTAYSKLGKTEQQSQTQKDNLKHITQQLLLHLSPQVGSYSDRPHIPTDIDRNEKKRMRLTGKSLVTDADIGKFLLSWAIRGILHHDYYHSRHSKRPPLHDDDNEYDDDGNDDGDNEAEDKDYPFADLVILYWSTLRICLMFFHPEPESVQPSSSSLSTQPPTSVNQKMISMPTILTLSTMHKIVPITLRTALSQQHQPGPTSLDHNDNIIGATTTTIQCLARDCYCRLVEHFYQPSFDVLCDSILPVLVQGEGPVGSSDEDNNGSSNHLGDEFGINNKTDTSDGGDVWYHVAAPTLHLMSSRLIKANPKKSFLLLVRPRTCLALAKIYQRCCNSEGSTVPMDVIPPKNHATESTTGVLDGLIQLLCEGLFSVQHHMNGYRSLKFTISTDHVAARKVPTLETPPTTNTISNFQCYQEGLLATLRNCVFPSDERVVDDNVSNDGKNLSSTLETSLVVNMIPLLLNIFLDQTTLMMQQNHHQPAGSALPPSASSSSQKHPHQKHHNLHHSKKGKSNNSLGQLQFGFFASVTGLLLRKLKETSTDVPKGDDVNMSIDCCDDQKLLIDKCGGRTRISLLTSVRRNLEALLENNVYQLSVGDTKEKEFLNLVGNYVVAVMTAMTSIENKSEIKGRHLSALEWRAHLGILDVLFQTDHTTLHSQLPSILAGICMNWETGNDNNEQDVVITTPQCPPAETSATKLFVTIVSTYSKLRQLDFFYTKLIESVSTMLKVDDYDKLNRLVALLDDPLISECQRRAIQECPIQQLKLILDRMNTTVVEMSKEMEEDFKSRAVFAAISVVTKCLDGILQHVRVDKTTAGEIYPLCGLVMRGTVQTLIERTANRLTMALTSTKTSSVKRSCISVCAWTMNLMNRCEFWSSEIAPSSSSESTGGPSHRCEIPIPILELLGQSVTNNTDRQGDDEDMDKEDIGLIEGLKFLACQRINGLYGAIHKKQKISFVSQDEELYGFQDEVSEVRKLVQFVLRTLCPSTDEEGSNNTKRKQDWVVLAQSIRIWAPFAEPADVDSFLTPLLNVIMDPEATVQERHYMLSILHDANFYELPTISRRLGKNIMSLVASNIHKTLHTPAMNPPSKVLDLMDDVLRCNWISRSFKEVDSVCRQSTPLNFPPEQVESVTNRLKRNVLILDVFEGLPIPVWGECDDATDVVESGLRVESVCVLMLSESNRELNDNAIRLVNSLRRTVSRVLAGYSKESYMEWSEPTSEYVATLLTRTMRKTVKLLSYVRMDTDLQQEILDGCKLLTGVLVEKMALLVDPQSSHEKLTQALATACKRDKNQIPDNHFVVLVSYACQLLATFQPQADCLTSYSSYQKVFGIAKELLWQDVVKRFDQPGTSRLVLAQSVLFIADMILASASFGGEQAHLAIAIESIILNKTTAILQDETKIGLDSELRPLAYLVSVLATVRPTSVRQFGLDLVSAGNYDCPLLITPLCAIATGMEANDLSKFFDHLMVQKSDKSIQAQLNTIHALILTLNNSFQVEVIKNYSSQIFLMCLHVMAQAGVANEVRDGAVNSSLTLLIELASRREIFTFRERDIALVLGSVAVVVRKISASDVSGTVEARLNVFNDTFCVVSLLLQRFAKQSHSCVPSVVISLTVMLDFCLKFPLPQAEAMLCGQKFSRLCELLLPHGDVYKKHIICLIVRFVDALSGELESARKRSLLPAVYCLLDIIQQHESKQVNSMLDEMGRALFRSVHDGYTKLHVYSGQ